MALLTTASFLPCVLQVENLHDEQLFFQYRAYGKILEKYQNY